VLFAFLVLDRPAVDSESIDSDVVFLSHNRGKQDVLEGVGLPLLVVLGSAVLADFLSVFLGLQERVLVDAAVPGRVLEGHFLVDTLSDKHVHVRWTEGSCKAGSWFGSWISHVGGSGRSELSGLVVDGL
jgi:hypothetical protein